MLGSKKALLTRLAERRLPVLLAVLYFLVGAWVVYFRFAFEIDPDEGYNLMKVLLVDRGALLYRDVWSDQPPGYTYLGVVAVRVLGTSAENVRLLTVLLAALLVFAVADILRRKLPGDEGLVGGVAATVCLLTTARFARFSLAAMIGLPSIALAVLSLWMLVVSASRRRACLAGSGALFAAALAVKLFTLFLAPVLLLVLVWQELARERGAETSAGTRRSGRDLVSELGRALAFWSLGFGAVALLAFGPIALVGGLDQLYTSHATGDRGSARPEQLLRLLAPDVWMYALALAGLGLALARRSPAGVALGAWCGLAFVALSFHSPLWRHHCLLISVPAAGLAGYAVGSGAGWCLRRLRGVARRVALAAVAAPLAVALWSLTRRSEPSTAKASRNAQVIAVERAIERHAKNARSMVTSRQMYAFRLGLPVPPELAVTSSKRFRSGLLDAKKVRNVVLASRPDIVVLDGRWPDSVEHAVRRAIQSGYKLVYSDDRADGVEVYVRVTEQS